VAKAHIHAASSAKKFGGEAEEYMDIHLLLDSSKKVIGDHRHRCLSHSTWFIAEILPRIFGHTRTNSAGRVYSVVDVGEQHLLEDFGGKFMPTAQDYLMEMRLQPWMSNGRGEPPSSRGLRPQAEEAMERATEGATDGEIIDCIAGGYAHKLQKYIIAD